MNIRVPGVKGGDLVVSPIVKEKIKRLIVLLCERDMTVNERFGILNQAVETGVDTILRRYEHKQPAMRDVSKTYLNNPQAGDRWVSWKCDSVDTVIYHVTGPDDFIAWCWLRDKGPNFVRMDRHALAGLVCNESINGELIPVDITSLCASKFTHYCIPAMADSDLEKSVLESVAVRAKENVAEDIRINKEPVNG